MLLTQVDVLRKYDVPERVLEVLAESTVKHVSIVGRRGPLEAAYTPKELREMIELPEASMVPLDPELLKVPEGLKLARTQSRAIQLLNKGPKQLYGTTKKTWSLDFYRSPTGLVLPTAEDPRCHLSLGHTMVNPTTQRAEPTGETTVLPTDLVVTSLGFHGEPTASFFDPGLGHLRTLSNRVITPQGTTLRNVYASGWASTGARGVINSSMMNAYDVAQTIISDMENPPAIEEAVLNPEPPLEDIPTEVKQGIKQRNVVQYGDWKKIDDEEIRRGEVLGKERERMLWDQAKNFVGARA
jgi:adrenodoxin-NADP+ reductase